MLNSGVWIWIVYCWCRRLIFNFHRLNPSDYEWNSLQSSRTNLERDECGSFLLSRTHRKCVYESKRGNGDKWKRNAATLVYASIRTSRHICCRLFLVPKHPLKYVNVEFSHHRQCTCTLRKWEETQKFACEMRGHEGKVEVCDEWVCVFS